MLSRIGGAFAALIWLAGAAAAQVQTEFWGIWQFSGHTKSQCSSGDWDRKDNDALINVGRNAVYFWESRCDILRFRSLRSQSTPGETAEATFACSGEGMTWRSREIWSLQRVESRRALVVVQLQRSRERDQTKQPSKALQDNVAVSMFLECK